MLVMVRSMSSGLFAPAHVGADPAWQNHPVPALYGFQSYAFFPIVLADGSFDGTSCALDPRPRALSIRAMVSVLERQAERIAEIISAKAGGDVVSRVHGSEFPIRDPGHSSN